jgi:uncharacterized protein YegL
MLQIEIYCILDRSGSMGGAEDSVIAGFNDFIKRQVKDVGNAVVTLVLFDDQYELIYKAKKLKKVPKLNRKVYFTRGLTALNDAVAKTLKTAKKRHDKVGEPDKAICLIVTDGYENDSKDYPGEAGRKKIKKMIKHLQNKKGWDFFFIGSEIDAVTVSKGIGIPSAHTTKAAASHRGTVAAYAAMGASVSASALDESVESTQDLYDKLMEDDSLELNKT